MIIYSSLAGGTGSGLMSLLIENLDVDFPKIPIVNNINRNSWCRKQGAVPWPGAPFALP